MIDDFAVPDAEYLVDFRNGNATMLCAAHMQAMRLTCEAAGLDIAIYNMPEDESAQCQACHLAEMQRPRIILPH